MAQRKTTSPKTAAQKRPVGSPTEAAQSHQQNLVTMVAARDAKQRWRLQTREREGDRDLAQALGGTQFAAQGRRLSLGPLDALALLKSHHFYRIWHWRY